MQNPREYVSEEELVGVKETRGGRLDGMNVYSVRLPGHVIGIEAIFGLKDENSLFDMTPEQERNPISKEACWT